MWAASDGGETIGMVVSRASLDECFVGDLFVEPSFRGSGIGARLLDRALAAGEGPARAFAFDAGDAAALALALRRGLAPRATLLQLAGALPREDALIAMAAGDYRFDVGEIDPQRHAYAVAALDRETRGLSHADEHERFAREATGRAFFLNGELVAYAYVWPDGRIGPMACASGAYAVQVLSFALATLQRTYGASWCSALVPAANVRVARALLRGGLRVEAQAALAGDAAASGFERYAAYHRLLP